MRAFGGAVEPSMTQEGNSPIFKQPVDEKKRDWPGADGLGVVERIGDSRRSGTAIIVQDYAACCFQPATSIGCSGLLIFFF